MGDAAEYYTNNYLPDEENEIDYLKEWKPYCYELKCSDKHIKRISTHGSCCTCQKCGNFHDDCICQYFEEPCVSCKYKE